MALLVLVPVLAFSSTLIAAENADDSDDCNYIDAGNVYPIGECAEGWSHSVSTGTGSVMYKCDAKQIVSKFSYGSVDCVGAATQFAYSPLLYDFNCAGSRKCDTANYTLRCGDSDVHFVLYVVDKCSSTNSMASCGTFNSGGMKRFSGTHCGGDSQEVSPLPHHLWCDESWQCTSHDPVKYLVYIGVPLLIFCCCMLYPIKAYCRYRKGKGKGKAPAADIQLQLSLLAEPWPFDAYEGDTAVTANSGMREADQRRYLLLVEGYIHCAEAAFCIRQGVAAVICDICYKFCYPALAKFAECHPSLTVSNNGFTVSSPDNKEYGTILFAQMMQNGFCAIEIAFDRLDNTSGLCIIGQQFATWRGGNKHEDWIMIPSFRVRFTESGYICGAGFEGTAMSGTAEFGFAESDIVCIMLDMANNVCEFSNKTQKQYKRFIFTVDKEPCGIAIYCINSEFTLIKQIFDSKQYKNGDWRMLLLIAGYIKGTKLGYQINITDGIQRMIYYFITG